MDLLDSSTPQAEAHKKKLFGDTRIEGAHELYWEIDLMRSLNIPMHEWERLSLEQKAMYQAQVYLSNVAEIIRRHYEIVEENKKAALEKNRVKSSS